MTHLELLQKLPSPIREQAIENAIEYRGRDWLDQATDGILHNTIIQLDWDIDSIDWSDIFAKASGGDCFIYSIKPHLGVLRQSKLPNLLWNLCKTK